MESQIKEDLLSNSGLDDISQGYLLQTVRWTKFIAIIGFIITGLALIITFFGGISTMMNTEYGVASSIGYGIGSLLMAILYFYPAYCLYQFSRYMKSGLYYEDKLQVMTAFRFQRNLYCYLGIMLIIIICIYAALIMFGGVLASMAGR